MLLKQYILFIFIINLWYNNYGDIMKKITINNKDYEIIKDDNDTINIEELTSLMTDYFDFYDYVLGDFSYNKLRLKGFYDDKNKRATPINKYSSIDNYIKDYCAFGCKYFIIKKIMEKKDERKN